MCQSCSPQTCRIESVLLISSMHRGAGGVGCYRDELSPSSLPVLGTEPVSLTSAGAVENCTGTSRVFYWTLQQAEQLLVLKKKKPYKQQLTSVVIKGHGWIGRKQIPHYESSWWPLRGSLRCQSPGREKRCISTTEKKASSLKERLGSQGEPKE